MIKGWWCFGSSSMMASEQGNNAARAARFNHQTADIDTCTGSGKLTCIALSANPKTAPTLMGMYQLKLTIVGADRAKRRWIATIVRQRLRRRARNLTIKWLLSTTQTPEAIELVQNKLRQTGRMRENDEAVQNAEWCDGCTDKFIWHRTTDGSRSITRRAESKDRKLIKDPVQVIV